MSVGILSLLCTDFKLIRDQSFLLMSCFECFATEVFLTRQVDAMKERKTIALNPIFFLPLGRFLSVRRISRSSFSKGKNMYSKLVLPWMVDQREEENRSFYIRCDILIGLRV